MKKTFCAALALTLVFALAACGQGSENPGGVTPSDLMGTEPPATPTPDPEPLDSLSICGIPVIRGGQLSGLGYEGMDYADGTLTINALELEREDQAAPIISFGGGDLEIIVVGECSIVTSGTDGIVAEDGSALSFSGEGSLSISTEGAAAIDVSGAVTVGCALSVSGETVCTSENVTAAEGFAVTANDESSLTVSAA